MAADQAKVSPIGKQGKKSPATAADAVAIIDMVVPMIALDVRRGIEDMEMLEASNTPVKAALAGVEAQSIWGHRPIQNALGLTTVLAMSRAFDIGSARPIEQQNKASLPLLAHYLGRQDVEIALLSRPSPYPALGQAEKQAAIAAFRRAWAGHQFDPNFQDAMRRLRLFRDYEVAHSLFDVVPGAPTYAELFQIVSRAAELATLAERAAGLAPSHFDYFRSDRKDRSAEFWNAYIAGVKASLP
jgi:hypothetical protein